MARVARVVAVGYPHHITQRGNNQQSVFLDDHDREKYLSLIESHSKHYALDILAYCLMTNHIHFIAIPRKEDSLAKTFNFAHMRYSQYFNRKMKMSGHLWQGRFYSTVMDEHHLLACARYIERNPVRAHIVRKPWKYEWSSAQVHCGLAVDDLLGVRKLFEYVEGDSKGWDTFIETSDDTKEIELLKKHTMRGLPVGDTKFIAKLEKKLGRALHVTKRGRPKKEKE
jgi:putative transposase